MSSEGASSGGPPAARFAYVHGFASGPLSRKAARLADAFEARGRPFHRPDLNIPSFAELTFSGALAALDALDRGGAGGIAPPDDRPPPAERAAPADDALVAAAKDEASAPGVPGAPPWCLVGSSMGGYLAGRWAELHPERVTKLLLLCPGFGLVARWPDRIGAEAFARWERDGHMTIPGPGGVETALHWRFITDARAHPPIPEPRCPTLVIHGTRDEVVPIESSRSWVAGRANARLIEVDDGHDLIDSLDRIVAEALSFFEV